MRRARNWLTFLKTCGGKMSDKKKFDMPENVGYLFKNTYKNHDNPSDKSPDYKGDFNVEGKVHRISLWKNKTKKGDIMLKLAVYTPQGGAKPSNEALSDDELPF